MNIQKTPASLNAGVITPARTDAGHRTCRSLPRQRHHRYVLGALLLWLVTAGWAFGVQLEYIDVNATVSATPSPQVTFTWDTQVAGVTMGIYRRVMGVTGGASTWILSGTVNYPTTTFTDPITDGVVYEYKIDRAYLSASVVEAAAFISVTLDGPIAYNADPTNVNAVYLFGRLPIVKSGDGAPDGHNDRPEATDGYYGDMTGTWTDTGTYYDYTAAYPYPVVNAPGDGIFDQQYYPVLVNLMVGRVDMAGMTSYFKEEPEFLRDYIHKTHSFRTGQRTEVSRQALWNTGNMWMERNWILPLMGTSNMIYAPFQPTLATTPVLQLGLHSHAEQTDFRDQLRQS